MNKNHDENPRHNLAALLMSFGCLAAIAVIVILLIIFEASTVIISQ